LVDGKNLPENNLVFKQQKLHSTYVWSPQYKHDVVQMSQPQTATNILTRSDHYDPVEPLLDNGLSQLLETPALCRNCIIKGKNIECQECVKIAYANSRLTDSMEVNEDISYGSAVKKIRLNYQEKLCIPTYYQVQEHRNENIFKVPFTHVDEVPIAQFESNVSKKRKAHTATEPLFELNDSKNQTTAHFGTELLSVPKYWLNLDVFNSAPPPITSSQI